jgi:hypothetical protein
MPMDVSRPRNLAKPTVQLRPSRIRRDPVRAEKEVIWRSREWEIRLGIAGILLFAIALAALWLGLSEITSH